MDFGLDGRAALVTGGGGRIGSTDCVTLAAEGAEVVVLDVDVEDAGEVVSDVEDGGGEALAVECDATSLTPFVRGSPRCSGGERCVRRRLRFA